MNGGTRMRRHSAAGVPVVMTELPQTTIANDVGSSFILRALYCRLRSVAIFAAGTPADLLNPFGGVIAITILHNPMPGRDRT